MYNKKVTTFLGGKTRMIAKNKIAPAVFGLLLLLILMASCESVSKDSSVIEKSDEPATSPVTAGAGKPAEQKGQFKPGLLGTYFSGGDFTRPNEDGFADDAVINIKSFDNNWGYYYGNEWSARWAGFIEGPYSGEVVFTAKAIDGLRFMVNNELIIDAFYSTGPVTGKVVMEKGKKVPVVLEFVATYGSAKLQIYWEWPGQKQVIVPPEALCHSPENHPDTIKDLIADRSK
jgi:hypothetical protein